MFHEKFKQPKGNVLFLILIAVALFAALSYAVTQSSNTEGDGTAPKASTPSQVNTAALTQYPTTIRTAVLRMIVNGVDPVEMLFNKPGQFEGQNYAAFDAGHQAKGVFHQSGGQATYQTVPGELTATGQPVEWVFNLDFELPLIGLSTPSSLAGNDLIAFASGISTAACQRINQELFNDATIPVVSTPVSIGNDRIATTTLPAVPGAETVLATTTPNETWFQNKTYGCFQNGNVAGSANVYFFVLAER